MVFLLFASAFAGDNENALSPQRMCTYAAGKGHEKSQQLIRVSAADYVMVNIQFNDPDKLESTVLIPSASNLLFLPQTSHTSFADLLHNPQPAFRPPVPKDSLHVLPRQQL